MEKVQEEQMREWLGRLSRAQKFHFARYSLTGRGHLLIGLPVVAGALLAASLAFGLPTVESRNASVWAGVMSVLVSIVAGIQTFLNLGHLAEAHLKAAKSYNKLKITVEHTIAFPPDDSRLKEIMQDLVTQWKTVVDESPALPPKLYEDAASARVAAEPL